MSSNNGKKLLVFGLSYAQQDNRKMQQILRHYDRTLDSPGSRAALFVALNGLAKELDADEAAHDQVQQLTSWLKADEEFPAAELGGSRKIHGSTPMQEMIGRPPTQINAGELSYMYGRYGPGRTIDGAVVAADFDRFSGANPRDDSEEDGRSWAGLGSALGSDDSDQANEDDEESNNIHDDADSNMMGLTLAYDPGHAVGDDKKDEGNDNDTMDWRNIPDSSTVANKEQLEEEEHMSELFMQTPWVSDNTVGDAEPDSVEEDESHLNSGSNAGPSSSRLDFATIDAATIDASSDLDIGYLRDEYMEDVDGFECSVCFGHYDASSFPSILTQLCNHAGDACLDCISDYIAEMVDRGALYSLTCPMCERKLSPQELKDYASERVYERYQYLKQQSEIPSHWISCTNPACCASQPYDKDSASGPKMVCKYCQFATCAKHRRPWHDGQTCAEFDTDPAQIERLEQEEATARLLSQEATSVCPKCGQGVTKMGGCDHMLCQCGNEYCFVVGVDPPPRLSFFCTYFPPKLQSLLLTSMITVQCSCSYENIIRIGETAHAIFCIYHPYQVKPTQAQKDEARSRIMGLVHGGEVSADLLRAREELAQRRQEEMRPKLAGAAEARLATGDWRLRKQP